MTKGFEDLIQQRNDFEHFQTDHVFHVKPPLLEDFHSLVLGAHGPRFPVITFWMNKHNENLIGYWIWNKIEKRSQNAPFIV